MNTAKENLRIYDALLSSPGMTEPVKIILQLSRRDILLLSSFIEYGINSQDSNPDTIIKLASKDSLEIFSEVTTDILKKGGLTEFKEKLKSLQE